MNKLPIDEILPSFKNALKLHANAVLTAPPGAGKTTRVPLALLHEPWLGKRKIIMLEPRRLAARMIARYMAFALGERVGQTVGYRVHRDTCVTAATRIELVTEGVLTRMLQSDPALEDVQLILFDEFHERSLQADLGLALALESQAVLREDLKIVVMSATLETENVAALLGNAPIVRSEGKIFPVETFYLPQLTGVRLERAVADSVRSAFLKHEGDILVFLPGTGEIRRVEQLLKVSLANAPIAVLPLYGELSQDKQDAALAPDQAGRRKVVLATSIAQTSLTVEGVQVVIDSGLLRTSRFSPRTGMSRLETRTVSRAVADQRRGRAGRLGPGYCYRLWTEREDANLPACNMPEILAADLAQLRLDLAAWGVANPKTLKWLDMPPEAAYEQAGELLRQLGALNSAGKITAHGRKMNQSGIHPRLAHMLLTAVQIDKTEEACCLAALLSERDFLRGTAMAADVDLRLRMELLQLGGRQTDCSVDYNRLKRLRQEVGYWRLMFLTDDNIKKPAFDSSCCGALLALAYPDRIGQNRGDGRFLLSNGRGVGLHTRQPLSDEPFIVVAELDDTGTDGRIFLAAAVDEADLRRYLFELLSEAVTVRWDRKIKAVRAIKQELLGALVLKMELVSPDDTARVLPGLLAGIRQEGMAVLPWTTAARALQQRLQFMHQWDNEWTDVSDEALLNTLEDWLAPYLDGVRTAQQLNKLNLMDVLTDRLTWQQQQQLNQWAPTHLTVPSGRRLAIDYTDSEAPVLAVKLQEMFGAIDTPSLADGKVRLTLHLLSPAGRPIQVTQDLPSFWREGYFSVKKDLKGRYPKHYWPENPFQAVPTSRVRPKEK